MPEKIKTVLINGKPVFLPTFIPSISSATFPDTINIKSVFEFLQTSSTSSFMISAFDLTREDTTLSTYGMQCVEKDLTIHESLGVPNNKIIFIDSGSFELQQFVGKVENWNDDPLQIYALQQLLKGDVFVIFDFPVSTAEIINQNSKIVKKIADIHNGDAQLMAVAHGYDANSLINYAENLSMVDGIGFIAITQKEFQQLSMAQKISIMMKVKNKIRDNSLLHLFAASNVSLWPLYILVGVNSFDSTNWINKTLYPPTLKWLKLSEIDNSYMCNCSSCSIAASPLTEVAVRTVGRLQHNMNVVSEAMNCINRAIHENNLATLARSLEPSVCAELESLLGKNLDSIEDTKV